MNKDILIVKNVVKKFGNKTILKDVSLSLNGGDILAFIGPNGAGKTTLIKLILGLQSISDGHILVNGYDIESNFVKAIEKVGAIVENPDHYMYMSGMDNLKLISRLYNVSDERIKEIVEVTKLGERINDKVNKYSLGMRQRLGIGIALLNSPNLLILDEPTNGLDPEGIKELRDLLSNLAKSGIGILISSHNLLELESFCNKVCIIKNGRIIESSDVDSFKKLDKSSYVFVVSDTTLIDESIEGALILSEREFKLECNEEDVPKIVKTLVKNKLDIYGISKENISLEDAFLNVTGGNVID